MKAYRTFLLITSLSGICFLSSCHESNDSGEERIFLNKLSHEWTLTSGHVTADQVNVTGAFPGMAITFSSNRTYTVKNAVTPIWPAGGSFTLVETADGLFDIQRDDGMLVHVSAITDTAVTLSLQYTAPSGRTKSISGQYEFVMNR